jgi:NADPH:quinone reductase-like Zn-dependent oxidoreductase
VIEVRAAGVGPWDNKQCRGLFGPRGFPHVPGIEAAGIVTAIGPDVDRLAIGDEVVAFDYGAGCYAEHAAVDVTGVVPKPASLSFAEAAAAPVAGTTAYRALIEEIPVGAGDRVLIHGASGGVGSVAVQIASHMGAEVLATCSMGSRDFVGRLGAHHTLDYRDPQWAVAMDDIVPGGPDVVLDCVGGHGLDALLQKVHTGGRLAYIVPVARPPRRDDVEVRYVRGEPTPDRLSALMDLCRASAIRIVVEEVFALHDARRAHARLLAGGRRGKLVLDVH